MGKTSKSTTEQIKSGFSLAMKLVISLLVFLLLLLGIENAFLHDGPSRPLPVLSSTQYAGYLEMIAASLIMYFTAGIWARVIPALAIFGLIRLLIAFVLGVDVRPPAHTFPRVYSGVCLLAAIMVLSMTFEFVERVPDWYERVALIVFVSGFTCFAFFSSTYQELPVLVGMAALLAAWFTRTATKNKRRPHRKEQIVRD